MILRQRVRGSVRAVRAVRNTRVFQTETRVVADVYDLHCFESDAEHLEFIDSLLADNKYLFPVAERVEGGVRGPNPTQRVLKAANE